MVIARSTPNIALIKYWGNRHDAFRLPAADSCSITLDSPGAEISVEHSPVFHLQSFLPDGTEKILKEKDTARIEEHLNLTKQFLSTKNLADVIPESVSIVIRSAIPPAIGIASSAGVFAALAKCYAGLISAASVGAPHPINTASVGAQRAVPLPDAIHLTNRDISVIARLRSGSAARSIFGGFATLINKPDNLQPATCNTIDSAYAMQIAPETHWMLHDIILVPTMEEKKIGSTEGHHTAHTSPLFQKRIEAIAARRQHICIDAILKKDFEALQQVVEEDCWDMHNVMQTQTPPLHYLNDETHRIVDEITDLREREHLPVLYTMDAGPTVHCICTEAALKAVQEFSHAQKDCRVFEAKIGHGATFI